MIIASPIADRDQIRSVQ